MSGSVADRNSGSGLTNAQAALFAATNMAASGRSVDGSAERVTRLAAKFLEWLEANG